MKGRVFPSTRLPLSIWLYVGGEFLLAFLASFLFFFVAFLVNQVLYMAEQMLARHADPLIVLRLLLYAIPSFIALSFPFASLLGGLLAAGRLNADNEIMVMEASGVSLKSVFMPFFLVALIFSGVSFIMNDILLPIGTIEFNKLYRKVIYSTPALELTAYSVNQYQSATIITGAVTGRVIHDLMIIDSPENRKSRTITASKAVLAENAEDSGAISLELEDVFMILTDPQHKQRFEYSMSDRMIYNIMIKDITESIGSVTAREMSSRDLRSAIADKQAAFSLRVQERDRRLAEDAQALRSHYLSRSSNTAIGLDGAWAGLRDDLAAFTKLRDEPLSDKSLSNYQREYFKKFALPAGVLCFVFLAFPISLGSRKSGRMVGFGIGLMVAVVYWAIIYWSDLYGYSLRLSPFWLMWFPNILILSIGASVALGRMRR